MIHVHNGPAEGGFISGEDTNCQESETFLKTKKRKMILDIAIKIFKTHFMSVCLAESNARSNCTERHLTFCEEQFNENTLPVCPEVVKLKTCLAVCENAKGLSTWKEGLKYESLLKKMNSYPDCVPVSKGIYTRVMLLCVLK